MIAAHHRMPPSKHPLPHQHRTNTQMQVIQNAMGTADSDLHADAVGQEMVMPGSHDEAHSIFKTACPRRPCVAKYVAGKIHTGHWSDCTGHIIEALPHGKSTQFRQIKVRGSTVSPWPPGHPLQYHPHAQRGPPCPPPCLLQW